MWQPGSKLIICHQVASLQAELDAKAGHVAQVMTQLLAYKKAAKEPQQLPPNQSTYSLTHCFSPSPPKGSVPKLHRRRLSSTTDQHRLSTTADALKLRQQMGTPPMPDPSPFLLHRQVTTDVLPVDTYHEKTVLPPITRSWEADEMHASDKSPRTNNDKSPRTRNTYAVVSKPHRVEPSSSTSPEVQLETLAIGQTRRDRNIRHAQKYNGTDWTSLPLP